MVGAERRPAMRLTMTMLIITRARWVGMEKSASPA